MSKWVNSHLVTPATRGFIYLIINKTNNKLYIGKKKAITELRVKVAGRVNRKKVVKPSNWKTYWGSCKELTADIKELGVENFDKYILASYDELHSVNYGEAELQFFLKVLDEGGDYAFYNKNIKITSMRPPENRDYIKRVKEILKNVKPKRDTSNTDC